MELGNTAIISASARLTVARSEIKKGVMKKSTSLWHCSVSDCRLSCETASGASRLSQPYLPVARRWTRVPRIQRDKHRLSSGKRIVIATYEFKTTNKSARQSRERTPSRLIVLDSPGDVAINPFIERESRRAVDICVRSACPAFVPAFIPSFVTDAEELERRSRTKGPPECAPSRSTWITR